MEIGISLSLSRPIAQGGGVAPEPANRLTLNGQTITLNSQPITKAA